jgi:tetratricopeptide (TPR) repeat protein
MLYGFMLNFLIRIGLRSMIAILATSVVSMSAGCAWICLMPGSNAEAASTESFDEDGHNAAYLEARLALAAGFSETAAEILEQCQKDNPESDHRVYSTLAEIYMSRPELEKVREILDQGEQYHPESVLLLMLDSKWYRLNGKVGKAISVLQLAHEKYPRQQKVMENLSDLYMYKIQNARTEEQINTEVMRLIGLYEDMAKHRNGDEKWRVLIILSRFYLRQDMPEKALEVAREALEINPRELVSLEELAKVQAALEDDENALNTYRQALILQPDNKDILNQIHELLKRADDSEQTTKDFHTRLADEFPTIREFQDQCIRLLVRQEHYGQAIKRLSHIISTWPDDGQSKVARGYLLAEMGRLDEASSEAIRMIREEKSMTSMAALVIAEALERNSDRKGAVHLLEVYNKHNEVNEAVYVYLADLLKLEGLNEKALGLLHQYWENDTESFLAVALIVELLREMERFNDAHELLDTLPEPMVQKNEEDYNLLRSDLYLLQSSIYQKNGRVSEAEELEARAIDILETYHGSNQDSIVALGHVVDMLRRMKRFEEAHRKIDNLESDLAPEHELKVKKIRADLFLGQGAVNQDDGQLEKAESFYRKAVHEAPEYEEPLNALGYFYAETNQRLDEAQSLVTKALQIRPDAGHIIDSLGWIFYHQGQYEQAVKQLKLAIDLMPKGAGVAEVYEHLGDTHFKMGHPQQARENWKRALDLDRKGIFIRLETIRDKIGSFDKE